MSGQVVTFEHRNEAIQTDWLVDVTMNYRSRFVVSVLYEASYQQYLVCRLPMETVDAGGFCHYVARLKV